MADGSHIEWTDATWNPLVGCTKVSPGCDNCYAEGVVNRFAGTSPAFPHRFDTVTMRGHRMLTQPLRWRRPRRIFVNSLSDLFHPDVPSAFIAQVFAVMALAPQHTFQLLTKRHGRMRSLLSSPDFLTQVDDEREVLRPGCGDFTWPLPNVWLGVSVEDQNWAHLRIPALLQTPAAIRWVSAEPLLGLLSLRPWLGRGPRGDRGLDWIVAGGESGPGARPMHPDWARWLRDGSAEADVPFLFKQWGAWRHAVEVADAAVEQAMREAGTLHQWDRYPVYDVTPDGSFDLHRVPDVGISAPMQRVGKKLAGRELDGRTHDDYPAEVHA